MIISDILNAVFEKEVGWRPVSGAIKPVHIANGLFRAVAGEKYDTSGVVEFLIPWKKKGSGDFHANRTWEHFTQNTDDPRFAAFRDQTRKARFEQFREFARGMLAADNAVFPSAENSSLTLTCRRMVSADHSDREVGRFMAAMLTGSGGKGRLGKLLLESLPKDDDAPTDPLSIIAWPLLGQDAKLVTRSPDEKSPLESRIASKEFADAFDEAAERLAGHEARHENRLARLERSVHFTCLSLIAHAQVLASDGKLGMRSPLLITTDAPKGSRLARASEESLAAFLDGFEDWLVKRLAGRLATIQPVRLGHKRTEDERLTLPATRKDSVRNFLAEIADCNEKEPNEKLLAERMAFYEQALLRWGKDDWSMVIAETLVHSYLREYVSGGPRTFLTGIGRKVGLIYPHFQGAAKDKRIRPSAPILEVLVRACVPESNPVRYDQFLEVLWRCFGLVVGGRTNGADSDAALLAAVGVEVGPDDLASNTEDLLAHLVELGLARRYPDNIAYVGHFHV